MNGTRGGFRIRMSLVGLMNFVYAVSGTLPRFKVALHPAPYTNSNWICLVALLVYLLYRYFKPFNVLHHLGACEYQKGGVHQVIRIRRPECLPYQDNVPGRELNQSLIEEYENAVRELPGSGIPRDRLWPWPGNT